MSQPSVHTTQLNGWLHRMRAGDRTAREELLRSVCGRLELLTDKMLRRFANVQRYVETGDVLNAALLRLLRSLEKLELDSMRAFYGLAAEEIRRELLDLARRFYGPHGIGANVVGQTPGDDSRGPLDPLDRGEDQEELDRWCRLHEAVANLPAREREVVSLVFYHGWTQVEIAELFQITERTVQRWWQSAIRELQTTVGGQGPPP